MTKKLLLFALGIVLALAANAYDFMVGGLCYNHNGDGKSVTVTYENSSSPRYSSLSGALTIPSSVSYGGTTYSVTSIGGSAFRDCSGLTGVTIPNSVTSIDGWAFSSCTGLTSITIPNSVTSIGWYAFSGTAWYNNQPNGLVYAGLVAYKYKGTMPNGTAISLKAGTKGIANEAFSGCTGLTSVTIPNSVTTIGSHAFNNCSGLTSVTIPNSVTSIGSEAFYRCSGLTSITIPNSVKTIGIGAFEYCTRLTSVTIPNSVKTIGNGAFNGCSGLTSITIPNSVTSIGIGAFEYCSGLTSIVVQSGNTVYDSRNNCNAIIETATNTLISGCQNTTIPNSVTSIWDDAFRGCSGLTSITIPNSVTTIGEHAFYGCSGLKRMEAYPDPTKVTMGWWVFENVPKAGTLHVLPRYYDAYQTRAPWSEFDPIIADLNESPAVVEDVDGNGTIDVGDINAVITAMLHGQTGCDITGDGIVDVSDVNRVITAALRQN